MKKYLSVYGLFARHSIVKIVILILCMATAECVIFYRALNAALTDYALSGYMMRLEGMIGDCIIPCLAIAFALISVELYRAGLEKASKCGYTLHRLRISERAIYLCQTAYNATVYVLLLVAQIALAFGLAAYYVTCAPADTVSNQTVLLAFYRSHILHSLLPLADGWLHVRNALLIVALALSSALFPYHQRKRKFAISTFIVALFAIFTFVRDIGQIEFLIFTVFILVCVAIAVALAVFGKEEDYEDSRDS